MFAQFHPEQTAMSDTDRSATVKVLLLNDDETTMEFVLEGVFGKTRDEALKLVLMID
jgi:ATP-dependent Clp protease adaptor protein ClpS